jgi:hypothetical protein
MYDGISSDPRGGKTIRHIDSLERRQHLSVAKIADVGVLPREVTPIGDTVFYAGDTKVDGYLTYSGLFAFNAATNARSQVLTADGKSFGKTQFHLKAAGNNLIISEKTGLDTGDPYRLWTVQPGQARARRLVSGETLASPNDFVLRNKRVYFGLTVKGGSALYSFDARTGGGLRREGGEIVFPYFNKILSYAGGLAILTYQSLYFFDLASGSVRLSKGLPKALTTIGGSVAGGHLVLNVTLPNNDARIYSTLDGVSFRGIASQVGAYRSVAYPFSSQNSVIWVNSTTSNRGTTSMAFDLETGLGTVRPLIEDPKFAQVGKSVYVWQYNPKATHDPESVGGYRPPGYSGSSGSISVGMEDPKFFYRLDLKGKRLETIVAPSSTYFDTDDEPIEAGLESFMTIGGITYFVGSDFTYRSDSNRVSSSLWATDGTRLNTRRVGAIFGTPIVAAGKLLYVGDFSDSSFSTHLNVDGVVTGRVVIDPNYARQFGDDLVPLSGRTVFIDMNGDGIIQIGTDPIGSTDEKGFYRLEGVRAGKRVVQLGRENGWEVTRGWSKTVRIDPGAVTNVSFGLRDIVNNASVIGGIKKGSRGATVFVDLDGDFRHDAGEPSSLVRQMGSRDGYQISGLTAGQYRLVFDKYPDDEYLPGDFKSFIITAGQELVFNL